MIPNYEIENLINEYEDILSNLKCENNLETGAYTAFSVVIRGLKNLLTK